MRVRTRRRERGSSSPRCKTVLPRRRRQGARARAPAAPSRGQAAAFENRPRTARRGGLLDSTDNGLSFGFARVYSHRYSFFHRTIRMCSVEREKSSVMRTFAWHIFNFSFGRQFYCVHDRWLSPGAFAMSFDTFDTRRGMFCIYYVFYRTSVVRHTSRVGRDQCSDLSR